MRDAPLLITCLESIAENVTEVAYEVIVVLNDPTPEISAAMEQLVTGASVFTFRANLGFGGGVNFAAERARGSCIVLLNDDCVVSPGWLESLVETAQRHVRCVAVGSTFLHPDGTLQEAGAVVWSDGSTAAIGDGIEAGDMRFERRCDYCSGGSLLIRKDVWDQLGGFDPAYYPAYFEDVDFCFRAAEAGWETWYQPLAEVRHARFTSTEANLRHYLWERAHETFVQRWYRVLETREPNGAVEQRDLEGDGQPDPSPRDRRTACGSRPGFRPRRGRRGAGDARARAGHPGDVLPGDARRASGSARCVAERLPISPGPDDR